MVHENRKLLNGEVLNRFFDIQFYIYVLICLLNVPLVIDNLLAFSSIDCSSAASLRTFFHRSQRGKAFIDVFLSK